MCCIFLRPHSFWTLHERFIHDSKFATFVSRQVQQVLLLDISRAAVQHQITSDAEGPHEQRSEAPRSTSPARPWQPVPELTWVSQTVCRKFGQRLVMQIASWFLDGNQAAMHSEMRWISLYQLYIDYMQCTGEGGPLKLDGWSDPADKPMASLLDISFKQRCIWLKNFSEQLILHVVRVGAVATITLGCWRSLAGQPPTWTCEEGWLAGVCCDSRQQAGRQQCQR